MLPLLSVVVMAPAVATASSGGEGRSDATGEEKKRGMVGDAERDVAAKTWTAATGSGSWPNALPLPFKVIAADRAMRRVAKSSR